MAAPKTVEITIERDGSSKVDALNFQGIGCAAATKELEMVLAGSDPANKDDKRKPEYAKTGGARLTN